MKTIGLLGGMSFESTQDYYRIVNEVVAARLGGLHSAKVVLHSVDFDEIERCQSLGEWDEAGDILGRAAAGLQAAGADFVLICTNTMHKVVDRVQVHITIPILHIADVTADALASAGIERAGLLGTRYTLTQPFLKDRLASAGVDILVPDEAGIQAVNRIIFDELCRGQVRDESRAEMVAVIDELVARGAQAVILGCTELQMLIGPQHCTVPVFDTTVLHATAAAELALA